MEQHSSSDGTASVLGEQPVAAHNLVERAIDILEYLAETAEGRSVTAVSDALGVPPSAAHRLLIILTNKGLVQQDGRTRDYRLTLALPALGLRYLSSLNLVEACRPIMDALADDTRELVRLAIVSGSELLWIAKAQGSRSLLRLDPLEGRSVILHVTAAGKAWLASMSKEQAAQKYASSLRSVGKDDLGPNAITEPAKFFSELELCRRRGYATTYEEAEPGIAAVGAAVRNGMTETAEVVGTISIAGPTARIKRKDLDHIAAGVTRAALQLSTIWPATAHLLENRAPGKLPRARGR
jgi:IclR family acetate operon transcriptional repressor